MSTNGSPAALNKGYVFSVLAAITAGPAICILIEALVTKVPVSFAFFCKWFIFWAAGVRLLLAGLKQAINPAFTAQQIFHLKGTESFVIVKELGFANICMGLTALISLFMPGWRITSAFTTGLYYGIAGFYHCIKKPAGANEWFALVSDIFIFIILALYVAYLW